MPTLDSLERQPAAPPKEPIQFIRLENPIDGWGIFRCPNDERWTIGYSDEEEMLNDMMKRHNRFHTPTQDGYDEMRGDEFCGFKSLEQLELWFTREELRYLISNDIRIYVITGKVRFLGEHQVIFRKKDIISKEDISELFSII